MRGGWWGRAEVGTGGGAGETQELGGGRTAKRHWDIRIKDCAKKKAKVPQAESWCYHPEHLPTIYAWEPNRASKTVPEYDTPKPLGPVPHLGQRRRGSADLSPFPSPPLQTPACGDTCVCCPSAWPSGLLLASGPCECVSVFFHLFTYVRLCWVFAAVRSLSLAAVSRATLLCGGCSGCRAPALGAWASVVAAGSGVVAHTRVLSPAACGICWDQRWNLRPLHGQADSHPLYHQGMDGVSGRGRRHACI